MKNTFKTIISLSLIAVFVILNWATSQEIDYRELNAEVAVFQDTLLIIQNQDNINVVNAELVLSLQTVEGDSKQYFIQNYALASSLSDTIPMIDFVDENNVVYPDSIAPSNFSLFFILSGNSEETSVNFSIEL